MEKKLKRTKIVATIGPASRDKEIIKEMIKNGVNVFRLNFSHGSHEDHKKSIDLIIKAEKELNATVGILADLCGPKIRVGDLKEPISVEKDQIYRITYVDNYNGEEDVIPVSYEYLLDDLNIGEYIYIADGLYAFVVVDKEEKYLKVKALNSGKILSRKGVNFPNSKLSVPALTEKDKNDLRFILTQPVDWIALSFVRDPKDIEDVKAIFNEVGTSKPVIAKIERKEAVEKIDDILDVFDGIMIARGDLGVEIPIEKVPNIQKKLIIKARIKGKPVITATQMLETMIENPVPTRAEVSDIANAIYDGTDAIMLSGETAAGKYPVEAVKVMNKVALETEAHLKTLPIIKKGDMTEAISQAIFTITETLDIKMIAASTMSGFTTQLISSKRPSIPIYAFTPSQETRKKLSVVWGVYPVEVEEVDHLEDLIKVIKACVAKHNIINKGDKFIFTAGIPLKKPGFTNMLQIETL